MNKEYLIKKAAEHGITLDETTAEKYTNLTDEELDNLQIAGGCGGGSELPSLNDQMEELAAKCPDYDPTYWAVNNGKTSCKYCSHAMVIYDSPMSYLHCKGKLFAVGP
jgi:hypothetical protein